MGGHLVPLGGNEALAPQSTEVDGVFFHRGALWFVECKPTDEGLRERAPIMAELVRSVGGVEARGLMVARRWRGARLRRAPTWSTWPWRAGRAWGSTASPRSWKRPSHGIRRRGGARALFARGLLGKGRVFQAPGGAPRPPGTWPFPGE